MADKSNDPKVKKLVQDIQALGYQTQFGTSRQDRPNEQLWVLKGTQLRAKVSLMLANRVNTMFNGIGRNDTQVLNLVHAFSRTL